jgi:cobalt-zinc-cadmium efflux system membrane fusion protein
LTYIALTPLNIKSTVKLTGRVELPPSGKAIAGSNLEGKVSAVHAMAGRYVQKGQKLFTIQNLEIIDWQQQLKMKQANLIFLEKELIRQKELSDEEITPVKSYESAINNKI